MCMETMMPVPVIVLVLLCLAGVLRRNLRERQNVTMKQSPATFKSFLKKTVLRYTCKDHTSNSYIGVVFLK